jgi:hypothetical protein
MKRRGWVEVLSNEQAGQWDVYDWAEHYDSGACLGSFDSQMEAARFAVTHAATTGRKCLVAVPS